MSPSTMLATKAMNILENPCMHKTDVQKQRNENKCPKKVKREKYRRRYDRLPQKQEERIKVNIKTDRVEILGIPPRKEDVEEKKENGLQVWQHQSQYSPDHSEGIVGVVCKMHVS